MPLDRLITLNLEAEGQFVRGMYVPGPVTPVRVWAQRQTQGSVDEETSGGTRLRVVAGWIIRYRRDVASHPIDRMTLTAEGAEWNVEALNESDARRRTLEISAIRRDSF